MQIVEQLRGLKKFPPVCLSGCHIVAQVLLKHLVHWLSLSVGLTVISSRELVLGAPHLEQLNPKPTREQSVLITHYVLRHPNIAEEDEHYFFSKTLTGVDMKTVSLENLSTATKTDPKPSTFENPLMKTIDKHCHDLSGMGRGCNKPASFFRSVLST